jgi:5'-3' exonuclease
MAAKSNPTFQKRQKEVARKNAQLEKAAARAAKREEKDKKEVVAGEDPDIAGIVPGPQKLMY